MKKMFLALSALSAFSIYGEGCPELSGKYACEVDNQRFTIEVSQEKDEKTGVVSYTFTQEVEDQKDSQTLVADNEDKDVEGDGFVGKQKIYCADDALKVDLKGNVKKQKLDLEVYSKVSKTDESLNFETKAKFTVEGEEPQEEESTLSCEAAK